MRIKRQSVTTFIRPLADMSPWDQRMAVEVLRQFLCDNGVPNMVEGVCGPSGGVSRIVSAFKMRLWLSARVAHRYGRCI